MLEILKFIDDFIAEYSIPEDYDNQCEVQGMEKLKAAVQMKFLEDSKIEGEAH